jgi:uncharacterized protein with GYD domain
VRESQSRHSGRCEEIRHEILNEPPKGVRFLQVYRTLGRYDAIWIYEAEDPQVIIDCLHQSRDVSTTKTWIAFARAMLKNFKMCRVPKLFRQEVSPKSMVKLTDKKIKWAVKQVINKGESTEVVAAIYGVSRRRIQQLARSYRETGDYPALDKKRRPRTHLSDEEKRIIDEAYNGSFLGARLLRYHRQKHGCQEYFM